MKKTMIFAAAAAMFMFASCQKEEVTPVQDSQSEELVFTATIDQSATKTTINTDGADATNRGKIEWVEGDEITITDAASTSVVYVAETGGASVSFTKKAGETKRLAVGSTYSATYKAAPATVQEYADYYSAVNQAKDLYMTAPSTSGTTLSFTAACGLLKLNLTASSAETDKTISKVEITGTPTGGTMTTYTLSCGSEGVAISSAADFYIALPAGSYDDMVFYNKGGYVCQKTKSSGMTIEANKIQPVTLTGIAFNLLQGKFSVSATKKVRFAKANLYWNGSGSAFHLESSQTAYPTTWSTDHVGHFYWTRTAANSYAASYSDGECTTSDKFFADGSDASHSLTIGGQSGLYALSKDEWKYLISTRGTGDTYFKSTVTVNGVANCLVIAPDGYTGTIASSYDAAAWATAETSGLVCLPAAGFREASDLDGGGSYGDYWSATPSGESAYPLAFEGDDVGLYLSDRSYGFSVRLVCSVSK